MLKLFGNLLSGVHYDVVQAHQILHLIQSPGKIDAGKQFYRVLLRPDDAHLDVNNFAFIFVSLFCLHSIVKIILHQKLLRENI